MFGIIICGRCHRPKGVDLSASKATCPHCGASIDVRRARVFFQTESCSELANAIRAFSERHMDIEAFEPVERKAEGDAFQRIVFESSSVRDGEERLRLIARGLDKLCDGFSEDDMSKVVDDPSATIERMLALDIVYEPSPGRYRYLTDHPTRSRPSDS
jgi:hypothetical protein